MGRMFISPPSCPRPRSLKAPMLKPQLHRDGIWRWGFQEVFRGGRGREDRPSQWDLCPVGWVTLSACTPRRGHLRTQGAECSLKPGRGVTKNQMARAPWSRTSSLWKREGRGFCHLSCQLWPSELAERALTCTRPGLPVSTPQLNATVSPGPTPNQSKDVGAGGQGGPTSPVSPPGC